MILSQNLLVIFLFSANNTTPQPISITENTVEDKISNENKTEPHINAIGTTTKTPLNTTVQINKILEKNNTIDSKGYSNETKQKATDIPVSTEYVSSASPTTTTTMPTTTSTMSTVPVYQESNDNKNQSQEYDEEEEEDDGFFFGNVLKLILSDSYETTIAPYKKKSTTLVPITTEASKIITTTTTTTRRPSPKPTIAPFIPMPHHHINYVPPKKKFSQNTVNRIDHLVLGEATAIKKTTPRPLTTPFKAKISSFKPLPVNRPTTQRPYVTKRYTEATEKVEPSVQYSPTTQESSRPPAPSSLSGLGPGLLKLAGCNIYGRMYRVGRIIAELSTPCQECWCTEFGVQCKQLDC